MDEAPTGQILLVVPEGTDDFAASTLAKLDHPVVTCHGPHEGDVCPLLAGAGCSYYDDAHGIVFSLDLGDPAHRAILRDYQREARRQGRDLPIRVVVPPGTASFEGLLDGVEIWTHEPTVAELDGFAAEIEAADRFA